MAGGAYGEVTDTFGLTLRGGRGLLLTESALTNGAGQFSIGLQALVESREQVVYNQSEYADDYPLVFVLPATFGLSDDIDLTAAVYGLNDIRPYINGHDRFLGKGSPESGLGAARAGVKVRFPFEQSYPLQIAARVNAVVGSSVVQDDGLNYPWTRNDADFEGSVLETLNISSMVSLLLEQGYVKSDSKYFDDQFVLGAGIMISPIPELMFGLEVHNRVFYGVGPQSVFAAGTSPANYDNGLPGVGDPNLLKDDELDFAEDYLVLAPTVHWSLNESIVLQAGAVVNLADHVDPKETAQAHIGITVNTALGFLSDSDNDGVKNSEDRQPETPRGYPVDEHGVALDSDGDGVPDGRDQEMDTPKGARVDAQGVGRDGDGDGVYDGIDRQPDTPEGCPVDEYGVARDRDNDGVPDCKDKQPNTPEGCPVDENGVALDRDNDGVPDCNDLEPGTPEGVPVDAQGRQIKEEEKSLLDEGLIQVNRIHFATGSSELRPDSYDTLRELAQIFVKYPSLDIRIEGHTDNTGSRELNMRLSRERAQSVRDYLLSSTPQLDPDRFSVVGYGPERPIAPNDTEYGRQMNRRVAFVVENKEELENLR